MSNPEWGVKRVCPETGKRFYDLNKSPIISPYTGKVVTIDVFDRRDAAIASMTEKSKKVLKDDDDDLLVDDDAAVDVDDELLEDEDDDTVALDDLTDVAGDDDD
ncbi:MAG: TIGR02300 family protein [Roseinatronobacter sp.]